MKRRPASRRELYSVRSYIDRLSKLSETRGVVVIVEGERDRECLRRLGVSGTIKILSEFRRELKDAAGADLRGSEFVLMTDFDSEGRKISKSLASKIGELGGTIIIWPREEYRRLNLPPRVEELLPYLERRGYPWIWAPERVLRI